MKVFSPTLEEFEKQCNELMDTLLGDPATLEESISAMSMDEFKQARKDLDKYLLTCYTVHGNLATFLRGGFDPLAKGASRGCDPLRVLENQDIYCAYTQATNKVYQNRFTNLPAVQAKTVEYQAHKAAIALEQSLTIKVSGVSHRAEKVIDVLWSGWECDGEAWLIKVGDTYKVAHTDHGSHYFADKDFLEAKIAEYEKALRETKEFLVWIS